MGETVCKEEMMHFLYGLLRNADQEILTGWVMEDLAEKKDAILEAIIDIVADAETLKEAFLEGPILMDDETVEKLAGSMRTPDCNGYFLNMAEVRFQWFKNGDHPQDDCYPITSDEGTSFMSEGKVVRYYRHPQVDGYHHCRKCGHIMHEHGWIDNEDRIVCPGDWLVATNDA